MFSTTLCTLPSLNLAMSKSCQEDGGVMSTSTQDQLQAFFSGRSSYLFFLLISFIEKEGIETKYGTYFLEGHMTRRSLCGKFMPSFLENCGHFRRSGPGCFGAFGTFLRSLCLFLYYFIVSNFDNSTVLRCNFSGIKLEPPNYTLDYTLSFLSVRVS